MKNKKSFDILDEEDVQAIKGMFKRPKKIIKQRVKNNKRNWLYEKESKDERDEN